MIVELISVGTELLLGDILNTNVQYLSREIANLGYDLYHTSVVGDNKKRLREEIEHALERSDIVILTGGLGATSDDLTKQVVSEYVGRPMVVDEASREIMLNWFKDRKISSDNTFTYLFPEGSTVLVNNHGIASGAWIPVQEDKAIVILPGPPSEMEQMFEERLLPILIEKQEYFIRSEQVKIGLFGEYDMYRKFAHRIDTSENPTFAPYVKEEGSLIRVTAKGTSEEDVMKKVQDGVEEIRREFKEYVLEVGNRSRAEVLCDLLKERKQQISIAESITGGLISSRITDVPGASEVISVGLITYSNEAKNIVLGVNMSTIEKYTAVSCEVAKEMVEGLYEKTGADLCVAVTGYAGPRGLDIGLAYIAILYKGDLMIEENHFSGDRDRIRRSVSNRVFDLCIMKMREGLHDSDH